MNNEMSLKKEMEVFDKGADAPLALKCFEWVFFAVAIILIWKFAIWGFHTSYWYFTGLQLLQGASSETKSLTELASARTAGAYYRLNNGFEDMRNMSADELQYLYVMTQEDKVWLQNLRVSEYSEDEYIEEIRFEILNENEESKDFQYQIFYSSTGEVLFGLCFKGWKLGYGEIVEIRFPGGQQGVMECVLNDAKSARAALLARFYEETGYEFPEMIKNKLDSIFST